MGDVGTTTWPSRSAAELLEPTLPATQAAGWGGDQGGQGG
jgi:hypothetical protein